MITSNETREGFEQFYSGLKELATDLDIEFEPEFIMQLSGLHEMGRLCSGRCLQHPQ